MTSDNNLPDPTDAASDRLIVAAYDALPSEEKEKLSRHIVDTFSVVPRIKINLPKITVPNSLLENLSRTMRLFTQNQFSLTEALPPMLKIQSLWAQQHPFISSDIFKNVALVQSNLDTITANLTKNMDFAFMDSLSKVLASFNKEYAGQLEILKKISFSALRLPVNLQGIDGVNFEEVEQVVMVDGIPLYGLPRKAITETLLKTPGASERHSVVDSEWRSISEDCRATVKECGAKSVVRYRSFAVTALDALDAGHTEAAQAMAGTLIDTIVNSYFGEARRNYTPDRNGKRTTAAYKEFSIRKFIAIAPLWQAYQQFQPLNGGPVPVTFSRHATAHTVDPQQYTRGNAVQGLMFACSLIYFLDEEERTSIRESCAS